MSDCISCRSEASQLRACCKVCSALCRYMNPKAALGVIALLLMLAANVGLRQADVRGPNAEVTCLDLLRQIGPASCQVCLLVRSHKAHLHATCCFRICAGTQQQAYHLHADGWFNAHGCGSHCHHLDTLPHCAHEVCLSLMTHLNGVTSASISKVSNYSHKPFFQIRRFLSGQHRNGIHRGSRSFAGGCFMQCC